MMGSEARPYEDKAFLLLIAAVTLLFAWILWPFFGAILWGTIFAIVFAPLQRALRHAVRGRRTVAALGTLTIIIVLVILPLMVVGSLLVQEATEAYERLRTGEWNVGRFFRQLLGAMPSWVTGPLQRLGLTDLHALQERLSGVLMQATQFVAGRAFVIGQTTFDFVVSLFVMLYVLFFLLRDGDVVAGRIRTAVPIRTDHQRALVEKFTAVVRATVKGNLVVAVVQGALGGLIFWLLGIRAPVLWAVVMALLSLLPAVGTAMVWFPVAAYLLATGAVWHGVVLIAYGVLVIGLVDNVLRPILVGKDTRMPDYVVLVSTLGGLAIFGFNGFVLGPVVAAIFIAAWDIFSSLPPRRRGPG
jgi:predicted PurR-regulated permease PerM